MNSHLPHIKVNRYRADFIFRKYNIYSHLLSFLSTDFLIITYSPRNIAIREQKW